MGGERGRGVADEGEAGRKCLKNSVLLLKEVEGEERRRGEKEARGAGLDGDSNAVSDGALTRLTLGKVAPRALRGFFGLLEMLGPFRAL